MILFTILAIIFLALIAIAILVISVGGTAFIVVFGDLIVCAALIGLLMRFLIKRKSTRR